MGTGRILVKVSLKGLLGLPVLVVTIVDEPREVVVNADARLFQVGEGVESGGGRRVVQDDGEVVLSPVGVSAKAADGADPPAGQRLVGGRLAFSEEALVPEDGVIQGTGGLEGAGDVEQGAGGHDGREAGTEGHVGFGRCFLRAPEGGQQAGAGEMGVRSGRAALLGELLVEIQGLLFVAEGLQSFRQEETTKPSLAVGGSLR